MRADRRDGTGRFYVLDGVDGCGKSTQAERLCEHLRAVGGDPLHLRDPGSTGGGERIRSVLLEPGVELGAATEALLFTAARRQLLDELVRPALAAGRDVVCDRFNPSTYAYQAIAGELDEELVLDLLVRWAGDPRPDRVVILDLDVTTACRRRGDQEDRIEAKGRGFQERVAQGYRRYAERFAEAVLVPADGSVDEVAERVRAEVGR